VTGGQRKLRNEEFLNFYYSPYISKTFRLRRLRWAGYLARMGVREMRTKIWLGSVKGLHREEDKRGWKDNIKMDIRKVRLEGLD
jgi:hypothetical protein